MAGRRKTNNNNKNVRTAEKEEETKNMDSIHFPLRKIQYIYLLQEPRSLEPHSRNPVPRRTVNNQSQVRHPPPPPPHTPPASTPRQGLRTVGARLLGTPTRACAPWAWDCLGPWVPVAVATVEVHRQLPVLFGSLGFRWVFFLRFFFVPPHSWYLNASCVVQPCCGGEALPSLSLLRSPVS